MRARAPADLEKVRDGHSELPFSLPSSHHRRMHFRSCAERVTIKYNNDGGRLSLIASKTKPTVSRCLQLPSLAVARERGIAIIRENSPPRRLPLSNWRGSSFARFPRIVRETPRLAGRRPGGGVTKTYYAMDQQAVLLCLPASKIIRTASADRSHTCLRVQSQ